MPLPLITVALVVSLIIKKKKLARLLRYTAIGALVFFSNPFIANKVMKMWEGAPTPISDIGRHKVAVVLTGITNRYKLPHDRVYFQRGADRVLHTVQLFKMGKINEIIISGGSGKLIDNRGDIKEADELALVFKMSGVPDSVVSIENASRNTYESAKNVAQSLEKTADSKVLLITSAFHMQRALACFEKQQIEVTAFRTDFYSHDNHYGLDSTIIPRPEALKKWNVIFHEILGILMYKMMGYS